MIRASQSLPTPSAVSENLALAPIIEPMNPSVLKALEQRIGRAHLSQRLGMEADYAAHVRRAAGAFFHIENWYSVHSLIRNTLRLTGLHARGRRNALDIQLRRHDVPLAGLPPAFDGYTLLQISDPHVDMNAEITDTLIACVRALDYDVCVLTGDYRAKTFGPYTQTLAELTRVRAHLKAPLYAVLGNHDTIHMVPGMEAAGIPVLLNECVVLEHDGATIYLAGIDDAHYYHVDNIQKAAADIPTDAIAILLSHTPEVYRQAAHSGFHLTLCGHTHGGQICLPGGWPILTDADCPRRFAAGSWRYHNMIGYTSVGSGATIVDIRLNCLPEITLHRLRCA